jgi:prevent-host-death family protein
LGVVSIRELGRQASRVVSRVRRSRKPAIVTLRGEPVAAVIPLDMDKLEDFVLAQAPSFVAAMRAADEDLAHGRTVGAEKLLEELEAD